MYVWLLFRYEGKRWWSIFVLCSFVRLQVKVDGNVLNLFPVDRSLKQPFQSIKKGCHVNLTPGFDKVSVKRRALDRKYPIVTFLVAQLHVKHGTQTKPTSAYDVQHVWISMCLDTNGRGYCSRSCQTSVWKAHKLTCTYRADVLEWFRFSLHTACPMVTETDWGVSL